MHGAAERTMSHAADDVFAVQWRYASEGRSLADAALAGARQFVEWAHHPRDDHVDRGSGARFYYHAHAAEERAPGEHGHFHLFVPHPLLPAQLTHVAGLSLDAQGNALRWFTTNAWVTGERWCPADAVAGRLPALRWRSRGRMAPLARWLSGMVQLYAPPLAELLHERDGVLLAAARREGRNRLHPDDPVLAARRLHIVSQRTITLAERLREMPALETSRSPMET